MDVNHQKILKNIRTKLAKQMPDGEFEDVVQELLAKNIITNNMKDNILCEKTQRKQVFKLLDILPSREPESFDQFYDILVENDLGTAADLLKPDLAKSRKRERNTYIGQESGAGAEMMDLTLNDELPDTWPLPDRCNVNYVDNIQPVFCVKENEQYKGSCRGNSRELFKMSAKERGRVLVINNKNFDDQETLSERTGTEVDAMAIYNLFSKIGFKVDIRSDKKAEEIREICKEYSSMDHSEYDCFVCFILSHGQNDSIFGVDGKKVPLEDIYTYFNGEHCESLLMKPKIFFIGACKVAALKTGQPTNYREMTDGAIPRDKINFFKINATLTGETAYRYDFGSRFIFTWIYVLEKLAYKYDLLRLSIRVQNLMMKWDNKQSSELYHTSEMDLYFFPGLCSNDVHRQVIGGYTQAIGGPISNPSQASDLGTESPQHVASYARQSQPSDSNLQTSTYNNDSNPQTSTYNNDSNPQTSAHDHDSNPQTSAHDHDSNPQTSAHDHDSNPQTSASDHDSNPQTSKDDNDDDDVVSPSDDLGQRSNSFSVANENN